MKGEHENHRFCLAECCVSLGISVPATARVVSDPEAAALRAVSPMDAYVQHLSWCASRYPGSRSVCMPPCEAAICPHVESVPHACDCGYSSAAGLFRLVVDGSRWRSVAVEMPPPNVPVIARYVNSDGKERRIRAHYAVPKSLRCSEECCDVGEYDAQADEYWCREGWYETNEHEETHWWVDEPITHWLPLPPFLEAPQYLHLESPP